MVYSHIASDRPREDSQPTFPFPWLTLVLLHMNSPMKTKMQRPKLSILSRMGQKFPLSALAQFLHYFYLNCSIVLIFYPNKLITGLLDKWKRPAESPVLWSSHVSNPATLIPCYLLWFFFWCDSKSLNTPFKWILISLPISYSIF